MDNGIQLISDGDGLAVIGSEADVERFLVSEGLSSKDRGLRRLTSVAGTGALVAQAGSDIAAESACWVKLTRESAQVVGAARSLGNETLDRAGAAKGRLADGIAERARRRRGREEERDERG
ncbi:hypothetical protein ACFYXC_03365 [Streptomyces sp. NPDC002701]|uniref:hypothetical protein n=1 Tax=Streptomyces sp. NPDC002701 TaxID=3364661 RepID=UPI00368F05C5